LKDGFDVHDYKRRMELAVIKLKENKQVDVNNRIKIFRFLDYAETQGIGLPRRIRYLQNLTKLAAILRKTEFQKASKDDIERIMLEHGRLNLAEETKALFRVMTKRFYRWLKDPDDEEYPPEVRWIKTTLKNNHKLLPEEILTEQEVMDLIKAAEWSRDRAFVAMLYDLGGRAGELLTLQRRNISFDQHGAVALLEGKTGQRRERLILSVPFIPQWLNEHPDTRPEAPLWIHSKQGCHEDGITPMDYYSARRLLQRLRARTAIKKRVNPQAFRHARATHLASILTEAQMKEYFGWTQGSKMPGRYVHLSGRDVDSALLRAHGLEKKPEDEKPKLSVVKCVRCDTQNSTINSFCARCGMPLDMKAALELEGARKKADDLMSTLLEDPQVQVFLKRRLKAASKHLET
jgi:site-specific recombinase XerD